MREQVAAVNAVLPHIAKLSNSIERTSWATRLADTLQIEEATVMQELRTAIRAARPGIRQKPEGPPVLRDAEARLVNLLLRSEDERRRCADAMAEEDLAGSSVATIVKKILELSKESDRVDCPQVLAALETDAEREMLTQIAFRDEPEAGPSVEDCLEAFKRRRLKREGREALRQVGQSLNNSGDAADGAVIDRQLQRLQELAKQRDRLA